MTKKMQLLFNEKEYAFLNDKSRGRAHVAMGSDFKNTLKERAQKLGLGMTQYVLFTALTYEPDVDAMILVDGVPTPISQLLQSGLICYMRRWKPVSNEVGNITAKKDGEDVDIELHMKLPKSVYKELREKASSLSMSLANYLVFAVVQFDVDKFLESMDSRTSFSA